jgi:hypothetical protein
MVYNKKKEVKKHEQPKEEPEHASSDFPRPDDGIVRCQW